MVLLQTRQGNSEDIFPLLKKSRRVRKTHKRAYFI